MRNAFCGFGMFLAIAMLATISAGCQPSNMATISGKVTLDGKPIENGTISFVPTDGNSSSAGTRITNGEYTLTLPLGTKRVEITASEVVGQRAAYGADSPKVDVMRSMIPKRYNQESELSIDVKAGKSNHDFNLES